MLVVVWAMLEDVLESLVVTEGVDIISELVVIETEVEVWASVVVVVVVNKLVLCVDWTRSKEALESILVDVVWGVVLLVVVFGAVAMGAPRPNICRFRYDMVYFLFYKKKKNK